jgi:ubiquinone/menaquinone biosynthesis C-methylase UbiE
VDEFERTKEYFSIHADDYADKILSIQPQLYINCRNIINSIIKKGDKVLDIGNGGVINYEFDIIEKLTCADLYISNRALQKYSNYKNIEFIEADIMKLDKLNQKYDVVIVQAVLHHLAGKTKQESIYNVNKAIDGCLSVLSDGGSLVILESTVSHWFEKIETILYGLMQLFFRICNFGAVYQFSQKSLKALVTEKCKTYAIQNIEPIKLDKYVWIMNHKIPSILTPCGFTFIHIKNNCNNSSTNNI